MAYGSSVCAAHDLTETPECMGDSVSAWCEDKWCWVDPANCESPHSPAIDWFSDVHMETASATCPVPAEELASSSYDNNYGDYLYYGGSFFGGSRTHLYYSYGTCGYLPQYEGEEYHANSLRNFASRLPGGKLRVAFPPHDSSTAFTLVGNSLYPEGSGKDWQRKVPVGGGVGGTNRSGSIPVMFDRIFSNHRIPWMEVWSPASLHPRSASSQITLLSLRRSPLRRNRTSTRHPPAQRHACTPSALAKPTSAGPKPG